MKTPEEYLEEWKDRTASLDGFENWHSFSQSDYFKNSAINFEAISALHALKSMQEDHEKELIEFAEYSQKRGWEPSWHHTDDKEKIIQFRNKQQDHDTTH